MIRRINIVTLLLISSIVYSQNNMTKEEVKKIKHLGKNAIIDLALKQLEKDVDTSYFKSIKVMACDTDIYVSFQKPIKFIPENSVYFYNATIFIKGATYVDPYKNPEIIDYSRNEVNFLKYDDEILEKIKFVINAFNKQEVIDTIDWKRYEDYNEMIIYDRGDHYYVHKSYGIYSEGDYSINKSTGVAVEESIASIEPYIEKCKVKYVEIKN